MEIIDDLVAEQERLDAVLAGLSEAEWLTEMEHVRAGVLDGAGQEAG